MSGIGALPEWLDAEPLDRLEEGFARPFPQLEIGGDDPLDDVRHLGVGHRRPEQRSEHGVLVGAAAERDLEELLAVLLDAEQPDVADMMMAAGVDATRDVDVQAAEAA